MQVIASSSNMYITGVHTSMKTPDHCTSTCGINQSCRSRASLFRDDYSFIQAGMGIQGLLGSNGRSHEGFFVYIPAELVHSGTGSGPVTTP